MYDKVGVQPAKNMPDLLEVSAKLTKDAGGPYGIGVRGSRSWATIHPGFLSGYSNYGQRDFTVEGGKLKAAMNTKVSKDYHKMFVKMVQDFWPEELVDLHLVSGWHRSRRRRLGDHLGSPSDQLRLNVVCRPGEFRPVPTELSPTQRSNGPGWRMNFPLLL